MTWLLRRAPALALLIALGAGGAAASEPVTLGARELVASARTGDPEELERVARRIGPRRLASILREGAREARAAALLAAPLVDGSWPLLAPLVGLMGSPDRPTAAAAARATAAIARQLAEGGAELDEVPADELAATASGCAAVAGRAELLPDVRVHALECALALGELLGDGAPAEARALPVALYADGDPEVRRAAVELSPVAPGGGGAIALAALVAADPEPAIAAAAAAALCAEADGAAAASALAALGEAGRARVRALAADPATEPAMVAGALPCLLGGGAPEDREVLAALRAKGPALVKARLRAVPGVVAAGP